MWPTSLREGAGVFEIYESFRPSLVAYETVCAKQLMCFFYFNTFIAFFLFYSEFLTSIKKNKDEKNATNTQVQLEKKERKKNDSYTCFREKKNQYTTCNIKYNITVTIHFNNTRTLH